MLKVIPPVNSKQNLKRLFLFCNSSRLMLMCLHISVWCFFPPEKKRGAERETKQQKGNKNHSDLGRRTGTVKLSKTMSNTAVWYMVTCRMGQDISRPLISWAKMTGSVDNAADDGNLLCFPLTGKVGFLSLHYWLRNQRHCVQSGWWCCSLHRAPLWGFRAWKNQLLRSFSILFFFFLHFFL